MSKWKQIESVPEDIAVDIWDNNIGRIPKCKYLDKTWYIYNGTGWVELTTVYFNRNFIIKFWRSLPKPPLSIKKVKDISINVQNIEDDEYNYERIPRKAKCIQWDCNHEAVFAFLSKHKRIPELYRDGTYIQIYFEQSYEHTLKRYDWVIEGEDKKIRYYTKEDHAIMYRKRLPKTQNKIY